MARDMVEAEETNAATAEKTNASAVRERWIAELRRQGHRKCSGRYRNPNGNVCALGLLRETALGVDFRESMFPEDIGGLAGLGIKRSEAIVAMNDGDEGYRKHTFAEIADVVEGWFK